jgi:mRNA (guanine-N7-)-methyltransferase
MSATARAYDELAIDLKSVSERQLYPTIHLRQFNNWLKSVLIDRFCPQPNATVCELACGKGGDIPKWKLKDPNEWLFGDISFESLKRAYEKYKSVKSPSRAFFLGGDIFACNIEQWIPRDLWWHIASCQFSLHYAFKDEGVARSAVTNLCARLIPGGYILITIPNACRIVKLLRQAPGPRISNSLFFLERNFDLDAIPIFGAEYVFYLVESVDRCAEYLVHPGVLESLFLENGCQLVETMEFHKYYHDALSYYPKAKFLFSDLLIRVGESNADMTQDEWDVISLYSYFVFRRPGTPPVMPDKAKWRVPKGDTFEIINVDTGERIQERCEIKPGKRYGD